MAENLELHDPWLVAVWPGMGNVALGAGSYLINSLEAKLIGELPARDLFDVEHVEVKDGVASAGRLPRNLIFAWKDPNRQHDLVIFLGEQQPNTGRYDFCHRLLDYATQWGVKRVCTFAAMATQLHPSSEPRVFGVGSERSVVDELRRLEVEILQEGQIGGLNGVLLAAAAEHGLTGMSLLGELPYFAAGIPNPGASKAALEAFTTMAGLEIDLTDLEQQAQAVDERLTELLERAGGSPDDIAQLDEEELQLPGMEEQDEPEPEPDQEPPEEQRLDLETRKRIERLFEQARQDRSKAMELKRELDRNGVFKQYEDRFLDLFKKGE